MKTCPCNEDPLTSHSYIVKVGFTGVYSFSYFCSKTYIVGTRYNRLKVAILTCTHSICFEQKYENSKKNQPKIVIFIAVKNRCLLHGRVFVMERQHATPPPPSNHEEWGP